MKEVYRLTCLTVPVAQPRQRHAVVKGIVRNYTPKDSPVNQYKSALQWSASHSDLPEVPLDAPLALSLNFYLPRPAKYMRKKDPDGPIVHTAKPDYGNLSKSTEDALNGIIWRDDSLICGYVNSFKYYHEKEGRPRVELVVYTLEE